MTDDQNKDPGDAAAASPDDGVKDAAASGTADASGSAGSASDAAGNPAAAAPAPDVSAPDAAPYDTPVFDSGASDTPEAGASAQDGAAAAAAASAAGVADTEPVQYGIGPFSLREVILIGVWVVAFVVSFFSTTSYVFSSVWTHGIDWVLAIGVPTVAVFLLVLRRLSPSGIRRVGSLGIDQFAAVAFSVAAIVWLQMLWWQVAVVITSSGARPEAGIGLVGVPWFTTWVPWVELIMMLAGVVLTVFAPLIPGLREDFQHRPETVSHRNARMARPVLPRPRPVPSSVTGITPAPAPAPVDSAPAEPVDDGGPGDRGEPQAEVEASDADATTAIPVTAHQAFWALVPEERDVVDEHGVPLFRIGPTAWALVIEDRGSSYVVRHEDGRVGLLNDVSGVTRG